MPPQPEDSFGIPPGLWNQEYQGMGGWNVQDMLARQQAQQQQQDAAEQMRLAQEQQSQQAAQQAAQQAQYADAQQNFVDWPTFQQLSQGTEPGRQYDGYLAALDHQLQQMGYAPEEAQQEVTQFQKMVPRPAEDRGFFGNLLESVTGGAASGTRAVRAAGAAGTGDDELLAKLAVEQAGTVRSAPLTRFQGALASDGTDEGWIDTIKRIGAAGVQEPQGLLDFFVDQLAQSYPVLLSGGGAALGGTAIAPGVGTIAGLVGGTAAGSLALDTGSTILEGLVQAANERGIDPNDQQALLQLLQDPQVRGDVINGGVKHGIPVAVMDGATSALSFGLGGAGARALRAGSKLRAAGLGTAALGSEAAGGAAGEALGQLSQFGEIKSKQDVLLEALGELGPGIAHAGGGAVFDQVRSGLRRPAVPTLEAAVPGEEELPAAFEGGPPPSPPSIPRMDTSVPSTTPFIVTPGGDTFAGTPENLAAYVAHAEAQIAQMDVEELPIENIDITAPPDRTLPVPIPGQPARALPPTLAVTPEGQAGPPAAIEAARQQERLAGLAPQVAKADVNDLESLLDHMVAVGIDVQSDELHNALDLIATAPKALKQDAIASVIDDLGSSLNRNAEPFALELMRIARQIQPVTKATPQQVTAALTTVAQEIGTTPEQVMPTVAHALAQEIVSTTRSNIAGVIDLNSYRAMSKAVQDEARIAIAEARAMISSGQLSSQEVVDATQGVTEPLARLKKLSLLVQQRRNEGDISATTTQAEILKIGSQVDAVDAAKDARYRAELGGKPGTIIEILPGKNPRYVVANEHSKDGGLIFDPADLKRVGEASATTTSVETPQQTTRGLKRGEPVPAANLAALVDQLNVGGPVQAGPAAQEAPVRSRRGLRAGVPAQGPVARGPGRGLAGAVGPAVGAGVTNEPVTDASGRPVRVVKGFQYGVEGTPDEANTAALQRMKDEALAKKRTGGLSKKARAKAQALAKAEYEAKYPGRKFEDDLEDVVTVEAPAVGTNLLSPSAIRTLQLSPFSSVMNYLSSVMQTPLQRAVAAHIETLGIDTPIVLMDLPGTQMGGYRVDAPWAGQKEQIRIDPRKATLKTVLHEAVHAATIAAYRNPETFEQQLAVKRIDELYQYVLTQLPNSKEYGLTNPQTGRPHDTAEEFIAEAFSNPKFQALLNSIPVPNAPKVSLWTAFKQFVLGLLGGKGDTALSQALLHGADLFTSRKPESAVDVAEKRQGAKAPSTAILGIKDGTRAQIAYAKGDKYTLYPTTAAEPRGVKGAGITNLTREQVEAQIRAAGNEVLAPVADTQPTPGTPKTSSTKLVGFTPNGDLQIAAYEQKDGSWTYYESDTDVRTDPDAKVVKGLTKDQAQRYLSQKNVQTTAPTTGAVKSASATPTAVGYTPPKPWEVTWANSKQSYLNIGAAQKALGTDINERVDVASVMANSNADTKIRRVVDQYVEPVQKAGAQISKDFNKSQDEIEEVLRQMHLVERSENKIRQAQRGNMDPQTLATFINTQNKNIADATRALQNLANPQFISAVRNDLAAKTKALADNTLDMAAQYGFLSRDDVEAIKRAYDYYVPLQHGTRTSVGKPATGTATTGDLSFARLQEQAYRTIVRGEANRPIELVARQVERGLTNQDGKPIATIGATPRLVYDKATNSINEGIDSHTFDENAIPFYRDGKRYLMTTHDDALLQAAAPYQGPQRENALTTMLGIAGAITHTMAIGKTALNPGFSAFNLPRDIFMASVNMPRNVSRVKFAQKLIPSLITSLHQNMKDAFGGEMTGKFGEARDIGAFISQRAYIGLETQAKAIESAFNPTVRQKLRKAGGHVMDVLVALSQSIESTTRYAVYQAALEAPGTTKEEAAYAAKTASINFENRGLAHKFVSPLYMFGNAKLQGLHAMYKLYERASGPEVATFALALTTIGFLAAATGMKYSDKDKDGKSKYNKIPDYRKDSMILFTEGGKGIPLPQEIAPFYVIGNAVGEAAMGGKTVGEASSRIFTNLMQATAPINIPQSEIFGHKAKPVEFALRAVTPSPLQPALDIATNRTTFGSDVVRGKEDLEKKGVPHYAMGSANENELAVNRAKTLQSYGMPQGIAQGVANPALGLNKLTGGFVDAAPQQIRLINNYLNPSAEAVGFWRDMLGQREPGYEGDIVNPLERKFTGKASGFYDQDQFDELLSKATQAKYQATQHGIQSLPPEEQALAKSADMLSRVQTDSKQLFTNQKLMSHEQRQLRQERARELLLDGIRRYNELRDRMPKQ